MKILGVVAAAFALILIIGWIYNGYYVTKVDEEARRREAGENPWNS